MDPRVVSFIAFLCVCGSAAFGLWFVLPAPHMTDETKDVVRQAAGIMGTLSALVLGLLVSTAQTNFDRINDELLQNSAGVLMLDRALAQYGPEAAGVRTMLKASYERRIHALFSKDDRKLNRVEGRRALAHDSNLDTKIRMLPATDSFHQGLQEHALDILSEIEMRRALMHEQGEESVPEELLTMLVIWLVVVFATIGLFAQRNGTVWVALMVCSLSASASIFLILELNTPFDGVLNISPSPMLDTLDKLGEDYSTTTTMPPRH